MTGNGRLILGAVLTSVGLLGLAVLNSAGLSTGGFMGGMMMGREDMKAMMSRMMSAQLPPGIDPQDLPEPRSEGARLLAQYCAQCHHLPGPGLHTAQEWPAVVERMLGRMQMMSGMMGMMDGVEAPTPGEARTLRAYLQRNAQRPIDRSRYADLATPEGRLFESACSQCHALPDPKQHAAGEWPGVIERMTRNMQAMGRPSPSPATREAILAFLQRHAKE